MKTYKVVCFGELLWDILPDKTLPGGAPMNVAYHLHRLSITTTLISSLGNDDHGRKLLDILKHYELNTDYIQTDEQHETGKVYAHAAGNNEMKYDIVQPVAWDYIKVAPGQQELMQQSDNGYLVFGSLAARNNDTRKTLLTLLTLMDSDRTFVLDINLRPPHYDKKIVGLLLQHCNILKINEAELELLGEWYQLPKNLEERLKALSNFFVIPTIITTLGDKGAVLLQQDSFYQHPGYAIKVADTIGSGDAFLAGFLYSTINNRLPEDALAFACAMGALIATYHGGCPDYQVAEIAALMNA
ncbi:fructokinase [Chitinophaga sp. CF118]|uniref:carbohydrate kinase family protein n=1 Tax=Chitinophaga sp. CF118 TaxID=1884367 RepID=UPI0008ECF845|nr:carbohydrate kinase [Chitinophaga sp. CF118]SFD31617.1 fructokinase [Chitinophaga sp. CF118]